MGRKAGVTSEETRAELLAAAARVFAHKGYAGSSIAEITREAGLSSGAVYAHFPSKAELFAAALLAHGQDEVAELLGPRGQYDVTDVMEMMGSSFDRRSAEDVSLLVEAIVAAKRDPKASKVIRTWFADAESGFAGMIREGQQAGVVDNEIPADTLARLTTMIALGSLLTGALRLPATDHEAWAALIHRLVRGFRSDAADTPARRGRTTRRASA